MASSASPVEKWENIQQMNNLAGVRKMTQVYTKLPLAHFALAREYIAIPTFPSFSPYNFLYMFTILYRTIKVNGSSKQRQRDGERSYLAKQVSASLPFPSLSKRLPRLNKGITKSSSSKPLVDSKIEIARW